MNTLHNANLIDNRRNALRQSGTTLIELMVAIAIFSLVAGTAFKLFSQQQVSTVNLQSEAGLTMALRNTASQLQMDLANAGDDYFQGVNIPNWPPVGISIINNFVAPGTTCYDSTSKTYASTCFDQVNAISANAISPVLNATGPSLCSDTSSGVAYGVNPAGGSLATTVAFFKSGDQLLFMNAGNSKITTVRLTKDAEVSNSPAAVKFTFHATDSFGTNVNSDSSWLYDPLNFTTCNRANSSVTCPNRIPPPASPYGVQYCSSDWIVKLASVRYHVEASGDSTNPWQLIRTQNGIDSVVMDQIIGFKVGASIWNGDESSSGFSVPYYNYDASTYAIGAIPEPYIFSLVRSVRISILARTTLNIQSTYHNTFDGGAYQVQGTAIVVNPRNLSMNDDQTQALP